ncbi:MAG TPA: hypothetical protein P5279_02665 [Anaerohalosphaeraceae bacterium]|jgi:hypothetical protein|nr:hypothetical protein [Anaerohalosphaeraceae bacterium]HRT49372.1 hypothetical protein [Anaerohalosphaeraceae bacterium]HRT85899.1 hypothetical protein [Anaerohalosphaeraceae bacterium]
MRRVLVIVSVVALSAGMVLAVAAVDKAGGGEKACDQVKAACPSGVPNAECPKVTEGACCAAKEGQCPKVAAACNVKPADCPKAAGASDAKAAGKACCEACPLKADCPKANTCGAKPVDCSKPAAKAACEACPLKADCAQAAACCATCELKDECPLAAKVLEKAHIEKLTQLLRRLQNVAREEKAEKTAAAIENAIAQIARHAGGGEVKAACGQECSMAK